MLILFPPEVVTKLTFCSANSMNIFQLIEVDYDAKEAVEKGEEMRELRCSRHDI